MSCKHINFGINWVTVDGTMDYGDQSEFKAKGNIYRFNINHGKR